MKKLYILFFIQLICYSLFAGGPKKIATVDRSLWPYKINTPVEFEFATKMEILVFLEVLLEKKSLKTKKDFQDYVNIKKVNPVSAQKWQDKITTILVNNLNHILFTSSHDFLEINEIVKVNKLPFYIEKFKSKLPENLKPWYKNSKVFYDHYVYELIRLALLFPRITSEILTLDPSEIQGYGTTDKNYLLTFDDGPTRVNGNTDQTIKYLEDNNLPSLFFVLGDKLDRRLKKTSQKKIQALYKSVHVGSHGQIHKSHARYSKRIASLDFTHNIIKKNLSQVSEPMFFRPPYGQRNDEVISFLQEKNTKVMLWNIDSQDWNRKISSREVAHRMVSLMLLWRSGILLFHDIHPKALQALPIILKTFEGTEIKWAKAGAF